MLGGRARGDDHDRRGLEAVVGAQLLDEIEAVELRHLEVGDDQVVTQLTRHLERTRTIFGDIDDPALTAEHRGHCFADRARVIDDEGATCEHHRRRRELADRFGCIGMGAANELCGIQDQLDLAGAADRGGRIERERCEQRAEWFDDDLARADDLVDRANETFAGERDDDARPALVGDAVPEQRLEAQHRQLLVAHRRRGRARFDERGVDDVDRGDRIDLTADLEQHRLCERCREWQAQAKRGAATRHRADLDLAAEPRDGLAHDIEADAATGELVGIPADRDAGAERVEHVAFGRELRACR